jgi:hypothetical protein
MKPHPQSLRQRLGGILPLQLQGEEGAPAVVHRMPSRRIEAQPSGGKGLLIPLFVCATLAAVTCRAQPLVPILPELTVTRSTSGQFIAQREPLLPPSPVAPSLANNPNYIRLETSLLPVACERIKSFLYREIGAPPTWRGRILVGLYPAQTAQDRVTITPEQFTDGWQYHVMLPNPIERNRYIQGLVQVLLVEMANRGSRGRSAEIPLWLSEGLAQQLLYAYTNQIFVPIPEETSGTIKMAVIHIDARRQNPLEQAHLRLRGGNVLTFQQLSWPSAEQLVGEGWDLYAASAQLFVVELLSLPGGRECLRQMIAELPQFYNWQFAFLHAFRAHFQRPLDVEKWWALQAVRFTGLELTETWSAAESWQKLDEIIRPRVQIRVGTNDLPMQAEVSLQSMIREWEQPRLAQTLRLKLSELSVLRIRVATNVAPVLDDYRQTLQIYLQKLDQAGSFPLFRKKADEDRAAQEAIARFDALDAQRGGLRPVEKPKFATPPNAAPTNALPTAAVPWLRRSF